MVITRAWQLLAAVGAAGATAATIHSYVNSRALLRPDPFAATAPISDRISVLIPARNEERTIGAAVDSVLSQNGVDELIVLDDDSTDATSSIIRDRFGGDPRTALLETTPGAAPPVGWLGKTWACQRLGHHATGSVFVFMDADVELTHPNAIVAAVELMRAEQLDLLCPYPNQQTVGLLGRLIQPLLQWSWMTFVPLKLSTSDQAPGLAVGNGQLMLVDAAAYVRVGAHSWVAGEVLDDIAMARTFRRARSRTAVVDGSALATCRMYASDAALIDGYSKSLWTAFGGPYAALAVAAGLKIMYVVPAVAVIVGPGRKTRVLGLLGYTSAVAGRYIVAKQTGQRVLPDVLTQPASIAAFAWLTAVSIRRKKAGTLEWKGRPLPQR